MEDRTELPTGAGRQMRPGRGWGWKHRHMLMYLPRPDLLTHDNEDLHQWLISCTFRLPHVGLPVAYPKAQEQLMGIFQTAGVGCLSLPPTYCSCSSFPHPLERKWNRTGGVNSTGPQEHLFLLHLPPADQRMGCMELAHHHVKRNIYHTTWGAKRSWTSPG